jgi:hypothetical protein
MGRRVREDLDAAKNPSDGQGREGLFSRCAMSTGRESPFFRKRRSLGLTAVVRLRPAYEPSRPCPCASRVGLFTTKQAMSKETGAIKPISSTCQPDQ